MRIATSSIYAQQVQAIDNQAALYAQYGGELASGKQLNAPSDDPSQIAQDLQLHITIDTTTQQSTNVQNAVNELTSTDSALSSLTSLMQSVRQNAVAGASQALSLSQTQAIGAQVDQALQQAIAVANTQYAGKYIFAGTSTSANPPVVQQGSPINGVVFSGNEQEQGQLIYNHEQFALSTTFQAAFNYSTASGISDAGASGSPDLFQTLITLRNTLNNQTAVDASATAINRGGTPVYATTPFYAGPPPSPNAAFATTPAADSTGNFSIQISGKVNGVASAQTITVPNTGDLATLVSKINAVTGSTGVTASFDATSEKITLTGSGSFSVNDVPTPAGALGAGTPATTATNAGNLTSVLNLASNANVGQPGSTTFVQNLTTQLGDIDKVMSQVLSARSVIGSRIQTLSSIGSQLQTSITDNTSVESHIEDTSVASVTSKFSQAQVALQAAYQTTNSLESKTLMNYMTSL
jgi:flagellar hook-associated protein 3 FlgL